jgi:hypothetical protein
MTVRRIIETLHGRAGSTGCAHNPDLTRAPGVQRD